MDGLPLLLAFGLSLAMSSLVGLALREYYVALEHVDYFGSVRTYTFIGMLGRAAPARLRWRIRCRAGGAVVVSPHTRWLISGCITRMRSPAAF